MGRREQVGAAGDQGDALAGIVDGDGEMIAGRRKGSVLHNMPNRFTKHFIISLRRQESKESALMSSA